MSVKFYTRVACPLCEEAEAELVATGVPFEPFDVDSDPELQRRFGDRVPVIEVDGMVVAEGNLAGVSLDSLVR